MADLDIANQSDFPIKDTPTATTLLVASDGGSPVVVEADRLAAGINVSTAEHYTVAVNRQGTDGGDTLANDAYVVAVKITRAS